VNLLASDGLWQDIQPRPVWKSVLVAHGQGRGLVVSFSEDQTGRACLDSLNGLSINAVQVVPR